MPNAAIRSTERQFTDLISAARQGLPVDIHWYRLIGSRPENYGRIEDLWEEEFDGLIVTGTEPRTDELSDEPFWPAFTKTVDWAAKHTISTIWSCLASHAAVLHLDGVQRQKHDEKIFGVFTSTKAIEHDLLYNLMSWSVPHARWNDLRESDLLTHNYLVLSKSKEAGVETFIKKVNRSLFMFIQSHPEYDSGALGREYRRDIARFQMGQQTSYPKVPANYFDIQSTTELEEIRRIESTKHELDVIDNAQLLNDWKSVSVQLYRNWLTYLSIQRAQLSPWSI
ncbi:unnamed protein product [Sphagnum tenellum]